MADGICLDCQTPGTAGQPCGDRGCKRRGYWRLPVKYAAERQAEPDPAAQMMLGLCIDQFLLAKRLGRGQFGAVYLALQLPNLNKVALKLLEVADPSRVADASQRMQSEAVALGNLRHPNIVGFHKFALHNGRPFLVMEYVAGQTLRQWLERQGRQPQDGLPLFRQLLAALETAHKTGVIHRDIKPENVLVESFDGTGDVLKVLDFGLAKFTDVAVAASTAIGTPMYLAPEQMRHGATIGPPTDLYAAGVIAFEMLFGRFPFATGNEGQGADQVLAVKARPDWDPAQHVPVPKYAAFFRKALAFDPQKRFASARQMRDEFDKLFAADRPTEPVPIVPPPVQPLSPLPESRRGFGMFLMAAGAVLLAGIGMLVAHAVDEKPPEAEKAAPVAPPPPPKFEEMPAPDAAPTPAHDHGSGSYQEALAAAQAAQNPLAKPIDRPFVAAKPIGAFDRAVSPSEVVNPPAGSRNTTAYKDNNDGTIWDPDNKLLWQKGEAPVSMSWADAKSYCAALELPKPKKARGKKPAWRLPSVFEMLSLVDKARGDRYPIALPFEASSISYWTASPGPDDASAWYVSFRQGDSFYGTASYTSRVRCVR